MAGGAGVGEYFRTVVEISGTAGLLDALQAGANELGDVGNSGRQPFHIGEIRLHLGPIERHDVAVHAALQATVDALFQRANLPFAPAILRKLAPYARQRHRVGLSAGLKVTVLAGKATAREALGRVDRGRTDLVCGIRKEGIAVFAAFAERVVSNRANLRRR